jgi:hypothetical protein
MSTPIFVEKESQTMRQLPEAYLDRNSCRRPAINEGAASVKKHRAVRTDLRGTQA